MTAEADSQTDLRICVHQEHALAHLRKPDAQVGAGGRLADSALLVCDR